jgi:hypothetical protein
MKKTWLPSVLTVKFWDKPAGTEFICPVQSELTVYVAVMTGKLTTPLKTVVPLPAADPFPSNSIRFSVA